jgi:hypothetical protein
MQKITTRLTELTKPYVHLVGQYISRLRIQGDMILLVYVLRSYLYCPSIIWREYHKDLQRARRSGDDHQPGRVHAERAGPVGLDQDRQQDGAALRRLANFISILSWERSVWDHLGA